MDKKHWIKLIPWIIIAAVAVFGLYQAISLAWVCDDAFISFRYAKNFINGNGLVFNAGEQVEGYTNFLWTILIALGMKLGLDPVLFSQVLGIICYLLTALIFVYISKKLFYSDDTELFVPLTAICILLQHDYHIYATSGLETSSYAMLLSLGFAFILFASDAKSYLYTGLIFVLAMLSRPDGLLFAGLAFCYILVIEKGNAKKAGAFLLPILLIYLPYWVARYNYYGYPFPNTYYAKSAYLTYYSQEIGRASCRERV